MKYGYLLLTLLLVLGCATSTIITGKDFDIAQADKIQKGITQKHEVTSMLGEPFLRTSGDSVEVWTYRYTKAVGKASAFLTTTNATGQAYHKSLVVTFNSKNVVQSVTTTVSGDPAIYLEK